MHSIKKYWLVSSREKIDKVIHMLQRAECVFKEVNVRMDGKGLPKFLDEVPSL